MSGFCTGCGASRREKSNQTWWGCRNYFGLSGDFCADCYDKISHNADREPNNPGEYIAMLLKLTANERQS